MELRRRRFSIRQVLELAVEITKIIKNLHQAGWVWNDCKPANLIVTADKSLRPIDFEGAYPVNYPEPFDWKTKGFSKPANGSKKTSGKSADIYALGAVIYFLLTGILYNAENPTAMKALRRKVPKRLTKITEKLLSDSNLDVSEAEKEFDAILNLI